MDDLPAIGLFRNEQFVVYEGDEENEKQILHWLTNEETLKIIGIIDEVRTDPDNPILHQIFFWSIKKTRI